jgi:hypothetical protein
MARSMSCSSSRLYLPRNLSASRFSMALLAPAWVVVFPDKYKIVQKYSGMRRHSP